MSVTLVMQAKRDLYFDFNDPGIPPKLYMKKGECRVMQGICTTMAGSKTTIMHTQDNFNFFVPMTKTNAKAAMEGDDAPTSSS